MTTCRNNEYGCDNVIPDDHEGEACAECEQREQATAAYWKRQYDVWGPKVTLDDVAAYSEPCERAKRERMLAELGD